MNESCHICMGNVTYQLGMSCMAESCQIWMSYGTCEWVMSHMNESCRTYEWVVPHICISHVTHINKSRHTYEWVMSHTQMFETMMTSIVPKSEAASLFGTLNLLKAVTRVGGPIYGGLLFAYCGVCGGGVYVCVCVCVCVYFYWYLWVSLCLFSTFVCVRSPIGGLLFAYCSV